MAHVTKKQKIGKSEEKCEVATMWHTIRDDIMTVIFSYLPCRDVGKASTSCKEWNRIFNSDHVQSNKSLQNEIRWAKYAGGYLQPKELLRIAEDDCGNLTTQAHVLHDGRRIIIARTNRISLGDGSFRFDPSLELYSIQGDSIDKKFGLEPCEGGVIKWILSNSKDNVVMQRGNRNFECWKVTINSSLEKVSAFGCNSQEQIKQDCYTMSSNDSKFYFLSDYSSIKEWDPYYHNSNDENNDDDHQHDHGPNDVTVVCKDIGNVDALASWEGRLFIAKGRSLQIWSIETKSHLKTINIPSGETTPLHVMHGIGVESQLSIEKFDNKNWLVIVQRDMFYGSTKMSIFSLEKESFVHVTTIPFILKTIYKRVFSKTNCNLMLEFKTTSSSTRACSELKIWRLKYYESNDNGDQEIKFNPVETINNYIAEMFHCDDELNTIEFLPDGRFIRIGHDLTGRPGFSVRIF